MPKAAFAGYVVHPEKRGALERHREKSPQKWRPLLGRANAVPMVREGKISGYMSIRTRATDEEIAAVEPL